MAVTEAEWQACDEPTDMREAAFPRASHRKSRLLACACYRRYLADAGDVGRQAVMLAEGLADADLACARVPEWTFDEAQRGGISDNMWWATRHLGWPITARVQLWEDPLDEAERERRERLNSLTHALWVLGSLNGVAAYDHVPAASDDVAPRERNFAEYHRRQQESASQANILRDIFGNPFRPLVFSPSWRTSTVVALASHMYESRDFSAMPILADALQDAGCDNDAILNHCRGAGTHTRGCWVVDLVLGKE